MDSQIVQIIEMIVALVAAIVTYLQRTKKIDAENQTKQVGSFFDPMEIRSPLHPLLSLHTPGRWTMRRNHGS